MVYNRNSHTKTQTTLSIPREFRNTQKHAQPFTYKVEITLYPFLRELAGK